MARRSSKQAEDLVWFVVYEIMNDTETLDHVITQFVAGFENEEDAHIFLKTKRRQNSLSIQKGWVDFIVEKRPLFH